MQLTTALLATVLLIGRVSADWTIYSGTCTSGFPDDPGYEWHSAATEGQGGCNGCQATDGETFGGNPCNCEDSITYEDNGNGGLNIIVDSTGINIGTCDPVTSQPFEACNVALATCLIEPAYRCVTYYCN